MKSAEDDDDLETLRMAALQTLKPRHVTSTTASEDSAMVSAYMHDNVDFKCFFVVVIVINGRITRTPDVRLNY